MIIDNDDEDDGGRNLGSTCVSALATLIDFFGTDGGHTVISLPALCTSTSISSFLRFFPYPYS